MSSAKQKDGPCSCPLSRFSGHRKSKCTFRGARNSITTLNPMGQRQPAPAVDTHSFAAGSAPTASSATAAASSGEVLERGDSLDDSALMESFIMVDGGDEEREAQGLTPPEDDADEGGKFL